MRKALKLVVVCLSALLLVGCNSGKEQSLTLTTDAYGETTEVLLEAKGDIVHTMTQTSTLALSDYVDVEDEEQVATVIETFEEAAKEEGESIRDIEGVDYSYNHDDKEFQRVIKIDTSNSNTLEQLSELNFLSFSGTSSKLSLEKSKENYVNQGWTVVE